MDGGPAAVFERVRDGDCDGLAALLSEDPSLARSVNDDGTPLLHAAAQTDQPELVETVLDAGADPASKASWGHTALEWAANVSARRAAALLLERGSTLTLWSAAALGRMDQVRRFLESELDLGAISDAFYIACRNGVLDVARLLRERGADVDALGYFDATALHWAAINGHDEVVAWLVREGADTRRKDPEFDATPAGWAREGGHDALARRLDEWAKQRPLGKGEAAGGGDSSRGGGAAEGSGNG